jgi:hypothetical protein
MGHPSNGRVLVVHALPRCAPESQLQDLRTRPLALLDAAPVHTILAQDELLNGSPIRRLPCPTATDHER